MDSPFKGALCAALVLEARWQPLPFWVWASTPFRAQTATGTVQGAAGTLPSPLPASLRRQPGSSAAAQVPSLAHLSQRYPIQTPYQEACSPNLREGAPAQQTLPLQTLLSQRTPRQPPWVVCKGQASDSTLLSGACGSTGHPLSNPYKKCACDT